MSKARDLINAHLYPVLATFAVVYGAIQIAPIAQQARDMNACVAYVVSQQGQIQGEKDEWFRAWRRAHGVSGCNGAEIFRR